MARPPCTARRMQRDNSVQLRCLGAALLLLLHGTAVVRALEYEMQAQTKCVYEDMNANVIVVGEYKAFNKDHTDRMETVDVRVEDPYGHTVYEERGRTQPGQFAFTTKATGEYKACFTVRDIHTAQQTRIKLDWKTGVAATDWNAVAKKEHLDALTVELRKLEDNIREVYTEMLQLQHREQEMRDISEVTNTRVAMYSIIALLLCVASGSWQLWYLRRFFQRKKLL